MVVNAPWSLTLAFDRPRLVTDESNASGPWWQDVHGIGSARHDYLHAVGWVPDRMLSSASSGRLWETLSGWLQPGGNAIYSVDGASYHDVGTKHTFMPLGQNENVTAVYSTNCTYFSVGPDGVPQHDKARNISLSGLPRLSGFRVGAGMASLWLSDERTLLSTWVTSGIGTRAGKLSVVAMHSLDGGFEWKYSGVVASADEVPYAHEGPSENALARLSNGSVLCVMRVEGESGHHSPYISKISDDGGQTWLNLRSLRMWPGETIAPGCVMPRLVTLNGSLVLAGGRPSPSSHDSMLWLNAKGDGEEWRPYSVSYWHNRLCTNKSWIMPGDQVNRSWPRYDTSYNSLIRTSDLSAYLVYGGGAHGFALSFRLSGGGAAAGGG
jgi:hypothetical protein